MSGLQRITELKAANKKSLAVRLTNIGVRVPDQKLVRHMMEATRLGFAPTTSRLRVACALLRRLRCFLDCIWYREFAIEQFAKEAHNYYGGPPPDIVEVTIRRIRIWLPDAEMTIYATYDDPWLAVRDRDEEVIVHGWYRKTPGERVELII